MTNLLWVCDIDGTIADDRERKLIAGPEPDRADKKAYLGWLDRIQSDESLAADRPVPGMAHLLKGLTQQNNLVYVTAREEKHRFTTYAWLKKHGFPTHPIIMRPNGSWLSTRELKECTMRELQNKYNEIVVLDDDGSGDCATMYMELGIVHLHVKLPFLKLSEKK